MRVKIWFQNRRARDRRERRDSSNKVPEKLSDDDDDNEEIIVSWCIIVTINTSVNSSLMCKYSNFYNWISIYFYRDLIMVMLGSKQ